MTDDTTPEQAPADSLSEVDDNEVLDSFDVPMHWAVLAVFFTVIAMVALVTAWCFRTGFTWSGICLGATALPLTLIFWYMLYVNPARSRVELTGEGLRLTALPFLRAGIPWGSISRAYVGDLRDERLKPEKIERGMRYGGYRSGTFQLPGGREAVILANKRRVVVLETGDGLYLLGPARFERFAEALGERITLKQ